ncbi:MAG: prepilin-type N-terminal cleavage/methylation domain-containing protein [Verrucomicrobiia bacterium]
MRRPLNNTVVQGRPPTGRRSGFSLVEIMISLGVIAIGLIAVVGLIPQGVQSARDAADNTLAATIAQDTFNQIRAQALIAWPPTVQANYYYDAAGTNEFNSVGTLTFYQVQLTTAQPSANLLTLSAMIMWPVNPSTVRPLNTNFFFTAIANYQH